jgi:hypothetical protein
MLAPMFALVLPVELGVVGLTGHSLMMLSRSDDRRHGRPDDLPLGPLLISMAATR